MIARVIHIITKLELGGAQENTLFTVSHIDRKKFSPALFSGKGGILTGEAKKILGDDFKEISFLVREINPIKDLLALFQLWRALQKEKKKHSPLPIIVHTHSSKAGILARWASFFARVPIIIHSFHGFGFNDFQPLPLRSLFIFLEKITAKITDEFIFVSRINQEKAKSLGIGNPQRYNLIRSGIEINKFKEVNIDREQKRAELGVGKGFLVTMVACLKPQKSPLDFARIAKLVLKEIPNSWFVICGDGELREPLLKLVKELELEERFKLLGWRYDVPEILKASDLLVLTSRWEGLPRVYPQAMASGLAIVGTRVDGAPEAVVDGETGYLFAPGDVEGMAEKVIELLKDEKKRKEFAEKGKERVEEFDISKMINQQEELYTKLLKEKGLIN